MEQGTKVCKVCGKVYPYCKNWGNNGIFRWQDVACCEEHGQQYFEEILRSRGELQEEEATPKKKATRASKKSEEQSIENE